MAIVDGEVRFVGDEGGTEGAGASSGSEGASGAGGSFFSRLCRGLSRSARGISAGLADVFRKKRPDESVLQHIEDLLIDADFGPSAARALVESLSKTRCSNGTDLDGVKCNMSEILVRILKPCEGRLVHLEPGHKPFVIMMVGVNGTGKTTTAAKIAHYLQKSRKSVALAACDTFRAAAVEQLEAWGRRLGVPVFTTREGGDSAALAFKAIESARAQGLDVVIIDTAGRLHNKDHLMAELSKIVRVVKKCDESAPHASLLVLDASVGQNALTQVEVFQKLTGVNGIVMTKLDGAAKGGILISVAEKVPIPIVMLGFGERLDDIGDFKAEEFSRGLLCLGEAG